MKQIQEFVLVIVVFLGISSVHLYAQSSPHVWLGGFAGLDIGNLSVTGTDITGTTFSSKMGFAVGGEFDDFFSDNFGICVQLAYVQKGTNFSFSDGSFTSSTIGLTFSYLQIPVLFKATFGSGSFKPVLFAGPEIGINLSTKESGKTQNGTDTTITIPDSVFSKINLGIMLGAGVTFSINQTTIIFLNAAYDIGLSNLNAQFGKNNGSSTNNEKDITNDIRINVGIIFGLGD